MKKSFAMTLLLWFMLIITACAPSDSPSSDSPLYPSPNARPPAVFVNDTYYQVFENRQTVVPLIDDTWAYLGEIQNTVPGYESPIEKFQSNGDIIGAAIYHSYEGHIPITTTTWGDPLEEEVIGDSIIVVLRGQRYLYISEDVRADAFKISDAVVRHSLMVNEVIYSLMGISSDCDSLLDDSYIFLGEVTSAAPI